jgi:hypothetical protein
VNAAAEGGKWEPAAEILSRVFGSRGEGPLRHLVAVSFDSKLGESQLSLSRPQKN